MLCWMLRLSLPCATQWLARRHTIWAIGRSLQTAAMRAILFRFAS